MAFAEIWSRLCRALKMTMALVAVGFCLVVGLSGATAASATLDKFGGLTLILPDRQWSDARIEESPAGDGTPWTRVVFDDPEGHSSIVVFGTANDGSKFAKIEDWISKQEMRSFLTWSVGKHDSGDFQRTGSDVSSLKLSEDVDATLLKEELTVNGDARRAWMLSFADPDDRYWYWIGFYSKKGLADHGQALGKVRAGLAWGGR